MMSAFTGVRSSRGAVSYPCQDVIRIEIPKEEYESMLEEQIRREKGGQ